MVSSSGSARANASKTSSRRSRRRRVVGREQPSRVAGDQRELGGVERCGRIGDAGADLYFDPAAAQRSRVQLREQFLVGPLPRPDDDRRRRCRLVENGRRTSLEHGCRRACGEHRRRDRRIRLASFATAVIVAHRCATVRTCPTVRPPRRRTPVRNLVRFGSGVRCDLAGSESLVGDASAFAAAATASATAGATRGSSGLGTILSAASSSPTTERMASAAASFMPSVMRRAPASRAP